MRRKGGGVFSIVLGIILLISGLIWGLGGSSTVTYENSLNTVTYHIGAGTTSGNVYIHADGSSEYFVALNGDFSPPIAQSDIDNSTSISFIARTDTTDINLATNGTTITQAHKVEKLDFFDKNGAPMATYVTSEYTANPNGVTLNAWSDAIWLVVIGLVLALLGVFGIARRRNTNFSIGAQPGVAGYPPSQPGTQYPPANPYGQQPYPPSQPGTQYPPSNPYNQSGGNPYQ